MKILHKFKNWYISIDNSISNKTIAKKIKSKICGIVGKNGGYTNKATNYCLKIPSKNPKLITPHTEGFQALIWHLIVSHPKIQKNKTQFISYLKKFEVHKSYFPRFNEECGVFGVINVKNASEVMYYGLHALQHRGQESSGIASTNGKKIFCYKISKKYPTKKFS